MPISSSHFVTIVCVMAFLLSPSNTVAQERQEEIETDRDSFTPATSTVQLGRTVLESAYTFIDNRSVPETHSVPEMVLRRGVSENVELRLGWNYEVGGAGSPVSGNVPNDLHDEAGIEEEARILYGTKVFLSEQRGWLPKSSFILQGFTPTYGEPTATQVSATPVFGWRLANDWDWDFAVRYGTGSFEDDHFNTWAPSTVLKVPVGDRWKIHAEYFGVFTDGREQETTQHFFSPGVHFLVTKNVEIGTRLGWGLNNQSPPFFTNAGIGWQF